MSAPVIAVKPTDPISHTKNLMLRHKVKRLVVIDKGKPVGMLSMRDIAEHMGGSSPTWRRRPIDDIPVVRVMHKNILAVSVGTDLNKAAALMLKHKVSSLLVQDGNSIAGVVTKTDLARSFVDRLDGQVKVRDLMSNNLVTVDRRRSLTHVIELMKNNGISRVVVSEGEKPVGIVTESDIAFSQLEQPGLGIKEREVRYTRKLERAGRPRARHVKRVALMAAEDIMRPKVITIDANEDAARAAAMMTEHGISGLPVLDGEKLVGIITKTDLASGIVNLGV